jgi:uncharacterized protein YxeA
MKRNLLGLLAVVLAVSVSSFTVKKAQNVYFIYTSGAQDNRSNYTETQTSQSTVAGTDILAWIRILDDNGTVTSTEFGNLFEALDVTNDSSNTLNDDDEKTITDGSYEYQLEKKNS